jgi:phage shock protein A
MMGRLSRLFDMPTKDLSKLSAEALRDAVRNGKDPLAKELLRRHEILQESFTKLAKTSMEGLTNYVKAVTDRNKLKKELDELKSAKSNVKPFRGPA